MNFLKLPFFFSLMIAMAGFANGEVVPLSSLNLKNAHQGFGKPGANKSVAGNPITIGGRKFQSGFGTHAASSLEIKLAGDVKSFSGFVGVDSETGQKGAVEFSIRAGGKLLWKSGVMKGGDMAKAFHVSLIGQKRILLAVTPAENSIESDHADWADAKFMTGPGAKITTVAASGEEAVILTPPDGPEPRIHGPKIFGVHPSHPFLYTIPATGTRPITFSAKNLPLGLKLDAKTGRITGVLNTRGSYDVTLFANSNLGADHHAFKIVVGDKIALTPPMGWNSWNCFGEKVDQKKVKSAAKAMVESGLANHGWTYINTDDTWQARRGGPFNAIQPNKKFPNMKGMVDYIHSLGLKAGIYSTPWVTSYAQHIGGSADNPQGTWVPNTKHVRYNQNKFPFVVGKYHFDTNDAKQWAAWGFDYLKYDWWPNDIPAAKRMDDALRASGRDMVYSLSNNATFAEAKDYAKYANSWRTTSDIRDTWQSISSIGFSQDKWAKFAGPGHWNDPDMLVVGKVGWGHLHPTRLTPNEQYTHISLWSLLSAPLLIGCDMTQLSPFTLGLLTNDEVIDIDQDALGKEARQTLVKGNIQVWVKELADGGKAVGIFNLGETPVDYTLKWSDIKVANNQLVRDVWREKDLGKFATEFDTHIGRHGVTLIKITTQK